MTNRTVLKLRIIIKLASVILDDVNGTSESDPLALL